MPLRYRLNCSNNLIGSKLKRWLKRCCSYKGVLLFLSDTRDKEKGMGTKSMILFTRCPPTAALAVCRDVSKTLEVVVWGRSPKHFLDHLRRDASLQ